MVAVIDPAIELRVEIGAGTATGGFGGLVQNHMLAAFGKQAGCRQSGQAGADYLDAHGR